MKKLKSFRDIDPEKLKQSRIIPNLHIIDYPSLLHYKKPTVKEQCIMEDYMKSVKRFMIDNNIKLNLNGKIMTLGTDKLFWEARVKLESLDGGKPSTKLYIVYDISVTAVEAVITEEFQDYAGDWEVLSVKATQIKEVFGI